MTHLLQKWKNWTRLLRLHSASHAESLHGCIVSHVTGETACTHARVQIKHKMLVTESNNSYSM